MYSLAIWLDGDIEKKATDAEHAPLYGLTFMLAGRFKGGRESKDGIRMRINECGGTWTDETSRDASAVIYAESASGNKLDFAKRFDMELLPEKAAILIFKS